MIMPCCVSLGGGKANATRNKARATRPIEIVWTAIPLAIVTMLFVLSARTMGISDPAAAAKARYRDYWSSMVVGGALHKLGRCCGE